MNSLSWVLYFIDVLGNLQFVCTAITIFGGCGVFFLTCVYFEEYDKRYARSCVHGIIPIICWVFILLTLATAIAIPSKQTMQLIAVSEASEMVVMNEEIRDVMKDVKEVLRTQLSKLKE